MTIKTIELTTEVTATNPVDWDLELTNGQLTFIDSSSAIVQRVRSRLWFFKGEWYQDQRLGVDYFGKVLIKAPDLRQLESMFRKAILGTPGVASVDTLSITIDRPTREATMSFTATTDTNQTIELDEQFIVEI